MRGWTAARRRCGTDLDRRGVDGTTSLHRVLKLGPGRGDRASSRRHRRIEASAVRPEAQTELDYAGMLGYVTSDAE